MSTSDSLGLFAAYKRKGRKIVLSTAYDLTSALIARDGGVDALLVGDSLGMVVLGHDTTLPVTLDDMIRHCAAVTRARPGIPVIGDMPFGSFHVSPEETVRHALRMVKEGGVCAVKVEGGRRRGPVIQALLDAEIPVMGHVGLTPQSVNRLGGFKVQGRGRGAADRLLDDAAYLEEVGCFSVVIECVPAALAGRISRALTIPTIGIGAGPDCDGQVLVFHDMLGLFDGVRPKFVKRYAELGRDAREAITAYGEEVRGGVFPGPEHVFVDKTADAADAEPPAAPAADARGYLASLEQGEEG